MPDPYDELPYDSVPIEWTAPERMAVAAMLQGGPRPPLEDYRYLELGCGDATNLLPLARYRPRARFVGLDGSSELMSRAHTARDALAIPNLELVTGTFEDQLAHLEGPFDYIVLHGVFSWVDDGTRHALLAFVERALAPEGLLYLSYNTFPGWQVRGLVREFVLAQTAGISALGMRATVARRAAGQLAEVLGRSDHPYSRLMANEFALVRDAKESYVAHEFLSQFNRAYWQSDLVEFLAGYGLRYEADADFAFPSAQVAPGLEDWLGACALVGRAASDTTDLLRYAQFRCSLFRRTVAQRIPWNRSALGSWLLASHLTVGQCDGKPTFKTPSGYEVVIDNALLEKRLLELSADAPWARPVAELFPDPSVVGDDLVLLHRHGAVELRAWQSQVPICPLLRAYEIGQRQEFTTPHHSRVAAPTPREPLSP